MTCALGAQVFLHRRARSTARGSPQWSPMSNNVSPSRMVVFVAATSVVLLWGASYPAIGMALGHVDPVPLAAVRFAIAGLVFAILLAVVRPPWPRGVDRLRALLSGASGIAVYNVSSTADRPRSRLALPASSPARSRWWSRRWRRFPQERFGPRAWAGTAVAFTGVIAIAAGQPAGFASAAEPAWSRWPPSAPRSPSCCSGAVRRYGALTSRGHHPVGRAAALALARGRAGPARRGPAVGVELGALSGHRLRRARLPGVDRALDHLGAARATNLLYLIAPWAALLAGSRRRRISLSTWLGGRRPRRRRARGSAGERRRRSARRPTAPAWVAARILIGTAAVGALAGCARPLLPRRASRRMRAPCSTDRGADSGLVAGAGHVDRHGRRVARLAACEVERPTLARRR